MCVVLVLVVVAVCISNSEARTLQRMRPETAQQRAMDMEPSNNLLERDAEIVPPLKPDEPSLFELLLKVLSKKEEEEEGGDGEKRNNFKQAKPCYWSLVSCY